MMYIGCFVSRFKIFTYFQYSGRLSFCYIILFFLSWRPAPSVMSLEICIASRRFAILSRNDHLKGEEEVF